MKGFLRYFFMALYFFCGDLFVRFVINKSPDEFPKYYWIGVGIFFFVELLNKLEERIIRRINNYE